MYIIIHTEIIKYRTRIGQNNYILLKRVLIKEIINLERIFLSMELNVMFSDTLLHVNFN